MLAHLKKVGGRKNVTVYQCRAGPSSMNHLAFMKNYSPGFIVSGPVKCNQANQTVKKVKWNSLCGPIQNADIRRWQKFWQKKVKRYQHNKQWAHLWPYSECRYMKVTKVLAQKRSKDTNITRSGIAMNTFVAHSEMKIYEGDKSLWPKQAKRY